MKLHQRIWSELSKVDVSKHVERKGNLDYLSWSFAYSTLCAYYPNNAYSFTETEYKDGTMMIECMLTITEGDETAMRSMWLPVMDYRNKPIANPDAFAINTTRMRCLVKCLAMWGLGISLYGGTVELTGENESEATPAKKPLRGQQKVMLQRYIIDTYAALEEQDGQALFELDRELQQDEKDLPIYEALERLLTSEQKKNRADFIESARKAGTLNLDEEI